MRSRLTRLAVFFVCLTLPLQPAAAFELISPALADSATSSKPTMEDVTQSVNKGASPEALQKVVDFLIGQAADLKKSLAALKDLSDDQAAQRDRYIKFLDSSIKYYHSVSIPSDPAKVKMVAGELRSWRETVYNPQVSDIVDFLLVYQAKSILQTSESRFVKMNSDVDRLIDLQILGDAKAKVLLNDAHLLLLAAGELIGQGEEILGTTTPQTITVRELIGLAVAKIKSAYKKFLEVSALVKAALK